jgi:hypothetical protein
MTDIEAKALALVNEIERLRAEAKAHYDRGYYDGYTNLLEQHEAFKQKVSDAVTALLDRFLGDGLSQGVINGHLHQFIIPKPKPDPLAGVLEEVFSVSAVSGRINAALEARGLEIREKGQ